MELAGELAVDRVLHDHVQHGAAVIHHDVQLRFHAVRRVPDCYPAHKAGSGALNAIAPGGSQNIRAAGAKRPVFQLILSIPYRKYAYFERRWLHAVRMFPPQCREYFAALPRG